MRFNNINWALPVPPAPVGPANDEIWYTSLDGNIVTPYRTTYLPKIVSNTYTNGKGVIKFETDITNSGAYIFLLRDSLESVTIPNSVTSISTWSFYGCSGLASINIPNNVTNIYTSAFFGCSSLASITIPNSVTSISGEAFQYCMSLTSISFTGTIAQYNAITKGNNWKSGVPATVVHCSDGDTPI